MRHSFGKFLVETNLYAIIVQIHEISGLESGEILEVTATDPGSVKDLAAFCTQTGNEMLSSEKMGVNFIFRIRKA
ncbi:MAG: sulfurtransferase TusA family protein [Gammaproteobacteria bacterium]|nr:sulfurtransferase TusA family protein [Gammaproteobacteria bacterium]